MDHLKLGNLKDLLGNNPTLEQFENAIKSLLTPDLAKKLEGVHVFDAMLYLGALEPAPATFNGEVLRRMCFLERNSEQILALTDFFIAIGVIRQAHEDKFGQQFAIDSEMQSIFRFLASA